MDGPAIMDANFGAGTSLPRESEEAEATPPLEEKSRRVSPRRIPVSPRKRPERRGEGDPPPPPGFALGIAEGGRKGCCRRAS